jgi:uncharacterized membrane protein YtjA (UPF0391 family)
VSISSEAAMDASLSNDERSSAALIACTVVPLYDEIMLRWAAIFFVISIIAALLGFSGIAEGSAEIAKILFFIFLAICLVFVVLGVVAANKLRS